VGLLARRLAARPWATLPSAANFPAGKPPTEDARGADRLARGAWLEWVNKPKELSAMLLEMKHGAAVRCVAYGADGRRMSSGGSDGRVVVWDAASGAEVAVMEHGGGTVFGVALSADGGRAASGGMDGRVVVWDAASGAKVAAMEHGGGTV